MELYRRATRRNTHEILCRFWPSTCARQGAAGPREPQPDVRTRCNYATELLLGQQTSQILIPMSVVKHRAARQTAARRGGRARRREGLTTLGYQAGKKTAHSR